MIIRVNQSIIELNHCLLMYLGAACIRIYVTFIISLRSIVFGYLHFTEHVFCLPRSLVNLGNMSEGTFSLCYYKDTLHGETFSCIFSLLQIPTVMCSDYGIMLRMKYMQN